MTARSIATVSLLRLARRKAARRRRRRLRRRRDFRERPLDVQRQSARRRQALPRSRAFDLRVPAVSRFRGHARAAARPQFREGRTQVRPDAGIADRSAADLQQCFAGLARRHRPRRGGFPRTRRTRRFARPARRLRGAGLGPPRQRLPRRLGNRAARRPQGDRNHSRQFSCAGAVASGRGDPFDPGRQDLSGPARGRAKTRSRRAVLEPAFPLLPRTGRSAGGRFHGRREDHRLCRPAVAGNFQRSVSRRLRGPHRHRRTAFADPAGRSAGGRPVQVRRRRPRCNRRRTAAASDSSSSPSAKPRPRIWPRCSASSAFARPARIAARMSSAGRRVISNWSSIASRMALPIRITSRMARASAPSRSMSMTPARP